MPGGSGGLGCPATQASPVPQCIQAPRSCTGCRQIQEEKAEENGGVPLVQDRPETLGCVALEVRHCHLAREDEGSGPGEQPDEEEETTIGLEDTGEPDKGAEGRGASIGHDGCREAVQLGGTELDEEKGGDDAEKTKQIG